MLILFYQPIVLYDDILSTVVDEDIKFQTCFIPLAGTTGSVLAALNQGYYCVAAELQASWITEASKYHGILIWFCKINHFSFQKNGCKICLRECQIPKSFSSILILF